MWNSAFDGNVRKEDKKVICKNLTLLLADKKELFRLAFWKVGETLFCKVLRFSLVSEMMLMSLNYKILMWMLHFLENCNDPFLLQFTMWLGLISDCELTWNQRVAHFSKKHKVPYPRKSKDNAHRSLGRYKNSISWNNKVIEVSKQLHEYYHSINLVQCCRHIRSLIFEQIRQMSIVHKTHSEKSTPKFLIGIVSNWPWYNQICSLLGKLFNWTPKTNFKT